jgi:hypothetical protein
MKKEKALEILRACWQWVSKNVLDIDIQDIFVFGGIIIVWYGVHMKCPWISWVILGTLMMAMGLGVFSWWRVLNGNTKQTRKPTSR